MQIIIKNGVGTNIRLRFPTGLALNRVTACFIPAVLEKQGISLTRKQALAFVKTLKDFRRRHPDWLLVEVKSAYGAEVSVKL